MAVVTSKYVVDDHIEDRPEEEAFVVRARIEALALEAGHAPP